MTVLAGLIKYAVADIDFSLGTSRPIRTDAIRLGLGTLFRFRVQTHIARTVHALGAISCATFLLHYQVLWFESFVLP